MKHRKKAAIQRSQIYIREHTAYTSSIQPLIGRCCMSQFPQSRWHIWMYSACVRVTIDSAKRGMTFENMTCERYVPIARLIWLLFRYFFFWVLNFGDDVFICGSIVSQFIEIQCGIFSPYFWFTHFIERKEARSNQLTNERYMLPMTILTIFAYMQILYEAATMYHHQPLIDFCFYLLMVIYRVFQSECHA